MKNKYHRVIPINHFLLMAYGAFRAAVTKVNITPTNSQNLLGYSPRMSDGIRDRIYHKVAVLHDGKKELVWVSSDLARVSPALCEKLAERLYSLIQLEKADFW